MNPKHQLHTMDRTLGPAVVLLLAAFALFEVTGIDLWVQDHFHDFRDHSWLVDAASPLPRLLFYSGPKTLIWIFGVSLIGLAAIPLSWRGKLPFAGVSRRALWVTIGTLALSPTLVATGKATTNVFTPDQTRRYGGAVPYVKVCEAYPENDRPKKRGRGFPAGHASGGFALMALAGLASTRRGRLTGVAIGLATGSLMGVYQMFKGAHYLSHTVVTACVCWIVFLALRRVLKVGVAAHTAREVC